MTGESLRLRAAELTTRMVELVKPLPLGSNQVITHPQRVGEELVIVYRTVFAAVLASLEDAPTPQ